MAFLLKELHTMWLKCSKYYAVLQYLGGCTLGSEPFPLDSTPNTHLILSTLIICTCELVNCERVAAGICVHGGRDGRGKES